MAWLNPPTKEGLSPKLLVYQKKFDSFQSIFALYTTAWNLVFWWSSIVFGSAYEPIKLQETKYPVLVVARTDKKNNRSIMLKIRNMDLL